MPPACHPNYYRPKTLLCLASLLYTTFILISWLTSNIKVQQLGFPPKGIPLISSPWTPQLKVPFLYKRAYITALIQSDVLRSEQYNDKPMLSPESRAFPMLYSIIILSSPDSLSISIKSVTPLPNRKLTPLKYFKEKRFIAGKTLFFIYRVLKLDL